MFDEVFNELRRLDGSQIEIELEVDDAGYLDRGCPSEACGALFKINNDDWQNIVEDEAVYCPKCGVASSSSDWNTPDQIAFIEEVSQAYLQERIGKAMQSSTRKINSRQPKNSMFQVRFTYQPSPVAVPITPDAMEVMTQAFQCDECNCRYSSVGAAFFCPACGTNSVLTTFSNAIETVSKTIDAVPALRSTLKETHDENTAEDSIRHIAENGLVKIVSSFQRFAEATFANLARASEFSPRRNLFQSLIESDAIFREATGTGYTDLLSPDEYRSLTTFFQQRHLLAHQDGIVDQQYIDRSHDTRFEVGQRLTIITDDVRRLVSVIRKLAAGIAALP